MLYRWVPTCIVGRGTVSAAALSAAGHCSSALFPIYSYYIIPSAAAVDAMHSLSRRLHSRTPHAHTADRRSQARSLVEHTTFSLITAAVLLLALPASPPRGSTIFRNIIYILHVYVYIYIG